MSFWNFCRSKRGQPKNCNSNDNSEPIIVKKAAAKALAPKAAVAQIGFNPDPQNPYCRLNPGHYEAENLLLVFYIQPAERLKGEKYLYTIHKNADKSFTYTPATNDYLENYVSNRTHFPINKITTNIKLFNKDDLIDTVNNIKKHACQRGVSDGYIAGQMRENQIYILLFDMSDKSGKEIMDADGVPTLYKDWFGKMIRLVGKPIGFILGHLNPEDDRRQPKIESYIDIVCSCPGAGRYMIQYFIDWTFANGHTAVTLNALPSVLAYYPKAFGFKHQASCNLEIPGDIVTPPAKMYDKKYLNKNPLAGKVYSGDDFYDDDVYGDYMIDLQERLYGDQQDVRCLPEGKKGDGSYKKTKKQLKDGDCGSFGYRMRLCPRDRI